MSALNPSQPNLNQIILSSENVTSGHEHASAKQVRPSRLFSHAPHAFGHLSLWYAMLFLHLNLYTATENEIMMIPGVGKRMAHEFKEYRPCKNIEPFRREMGKYWNAKEVARLESYVTLD